MHFLALLVLSAAALCAQPFSPKIPKFWDDHEVESFEVPLANPKYSPRHMSSAEYYALKVRPIYKTYPVYAPGREPAGYREHLKTLEPEITFDPTKFRTKADWIAAGKLVFESETRYSPAPEKGVRFPTPLPPNADGTLPDFIPGGRYIIRKKGVLEVGINSCAGCHTRVMPDGSYLPGAQGMFDFPMSTKAIEDRIGTPERLRTYQERSWFLFGAPWIESKESLFARLTKETAAQHLAVRRSGILGRQGTSEFAPPHIPSLIGIEHRRFLDATGFARHRNIGDLARYAITNQGLDMLAHFGDFQPGAGAPPIFSSEIGTRYSDEQLYALGLYLYSLQPPPNPNQPSDQSRHGEKIFTQQGCAACHPAPHYTNNKLTPAKGFTVPEDLRRSGDVLDVSVGTDPTLALTTRRGTGFYKVPSLRGLWYRNALGHGGWVDTLEEWLDPGRLKPDFVPKNPNAPRGAVPGHEFGFKLSSDDRAALIAFLKTL